METDERPANGLCLKADDQLSLLQSWHTMSACMPCKSRHYKNRHLPWLDALYPVSMRHCVDFMGQIGQTQHRLSGQQESGMLPTCRSFFWRFRMRLAASAAALAPPAAAACSDFADGAAVSFIVSATTPEHTERPIEGWSTVLWSCAC